MCKFFNENLMSAILGAVIGGLVTYCSEKHFRNSDKKQQEKHYASMLYYDLKSIEDYLLYEKSSVDIRYSVDWQHLVTNCSFLKPEYVSYIYNIYDGIYNFDFLFQRNKEQGIPNIKENSLSYKKLQGLLKKDEKSIYSAIIQELWNRM